MSNRKLNRKLFCSIGVDAKPFYFLVDGGEINRINDLLNAIKSFATQNLNYYENVSTSFSLNRVNNDPEIKVTISCSCERLYTLEINIKFEHFTHSGESISFIFSSVDGIDDINICQDFTFYFSEVHNDPLGPLFFELDHFLTLVPHEYREMIIKKVLIETLPGGANDEDKRS